MVLLEVKELEKRFGQHQALSQVSIGIHPGEVHALVGENGAGKSTFIKMMTGVYQPDGGKILWQGQEVVISSPNDARALGVNVIHQDRHLVPHFTGMENLFLGLPYPRRKWLPGVKWKEMKKRAEQLQSELGIQLPLDRLAKDLTPPQKTLLEILRAMMLECKLLILDEPTAALTDQEAELLFSLIRRLQSQGTAILYVSHRLEEVLQLSSRITVLRNGRVAATLPREECTQDTLIHHMTEGSMTGQSAETRVQSKAKGSVLLDIKNLSTKDGLVRGVDLCIRRGEIVGIFGLAGAGRTELLEAIYGLRAIRQGEIIFNGEPFKEPSPDKSLSHGMVLIPEDRRGHALVMNMTIRENMTLPRIADFTRMGVIQGQREAAEVGKWMGSLQIKAQSAEQAVSELSGGNQQKVVFSKALMMSPSLFLCDEPTQAVDVMTRKEIHRLLREQAEKGNGVLFVSSDLEEVLEVADRMVVIHAGQSIADLEAEGLSAEQVLQFCYRHGKEGMVIQ